MNARKKILINRNSKCIRIQKCIRYFFTFILPEKIELGQNINFFTDLILCYWTTFWFLGVFFFFFDVLRMFLGENRFSPLSNFLATIMMAKPLFFFYKKIGATDMLPMFLEKK